MDFAIPRKNKLHIYLLLFSFVSLLLSSIFTPVTASIHIYDRQLFNDVGNSLLLYGKTLGGLNSKVLLVGITYFVASELLDITEYVGTVNDISGRARLFLVLPHAFLDAFLILWIFTSLSKTLEQPQMKRSSVKLDIYRKFSNALAVTVIASVAWIGFEVYFKATDPFNDRWQSAWIITAFWDVTAFILLCVICYLWHHLRLHRDMPMPEK